ncbi:MAG: hypothetical protein LBM00_01100 [Deltaproteobacteria bacterium]|nr:hypothetical protein [Deltaproteobacteria bacterium]
MWAKKHFSLVCACGLKPHAYSGYLETIFTSRHMANDGDCLRKPEKELALAYSISNIVRQAR